MIFFIFDLLDLVDGFVERKRFGSYKIVVGKE